MAQQSEEEKKSMTEQETALIEIMKKQNLEASKLPPAEEAKLKGGTPGHQFWNTQPMPHGGRSALPEGPIDPNSDPSEIRQTPYTMPAGFEWSNVDIQEENQRTELYNLLTTNYVEDDDNNFRFDYSADFLVWALNPPGFNPDYIFGVRSSKTKKLIAFISGIPIHSRIYEKEIETVEINFLCVHKKLRSKRLTPVLIKEVTRRANLNGIFQAVYTAGRYLPVPVAKCHYWHRSLNPQKLVDVGFTRLHPRLTMARMLKMFKLPKSTDTPGLRPMEEKHVDKVHVLLNNYLDRFQLRMLFTRDEVAHWLLPRDKVVYSYVVENGSGEVTDLISFYNLPSSILAKNDTLYAAYSFYNVATSVAYEELMRDALILAKKDGFDVFNALDLMDNKEMFESLRFGKGDGTLHYYVFNWACPEMASEKVGMVLL